jgi:hypothetical protein
MNRKTVDNEGLLRTLRPKSLGRKTFIIYSLLGFLRKKLKLSPKQGCQVQKNLGPNPQK